MKATISETIACAFLPCLARWYEKKASQRNDPGAAMVARGLLWGASGFYTITCLSVAGGMICRKAEDPRIRCISGCATLILGYMNCKGGRRLYQQAGLFRTYYYDSRPFLLQIVNRLFT